MGSSWYYVAEIPWLILLSFIGHIQELGINVGEIDIWVSANMMGGEADHVGLYYLITRFEDDGPGPG